MPVKDETEHKKKEKESATVQELFRGLFNSSNDAIAFGGMDGVLIDVNKSFSKLTGYSKEELLMGKTYQDITPKEYDELEGNMLEKLLATGTPQEFEKEYIRKDGSRVPIQLIVFFLKGSGGNPIALAAIVKDITERKLAEKELKKHKDHLEELVEKRTKLLRESEEKFKNLFNNSPNSISLLDRKGKIKDINPMFEKTWGYSRKELIGKNFMRFQWFYQKEIPLVTSLFKKLLNGNTPKPIEMGQRKKDGTPIWVYVLFSFVKIGQEELIQVITQDITKIKDSEQKLKKSEIKYRELYEDAPNAYFSINPDGEILQSNRMATKILGYDEEELLNMKVFDLYFDSKEGKEKAKVVFSRYLNGKIIQDEELLMRHKSGSPLWISLSVKALKDEKGKILESRSIVIDITERKQVEQELLIKDSAIRSSINAIAISNLEGVLTYVNPSFLTIWGYSSDTEILGKHGRDFWRSKDKADEIIQHIQNTGNWLGELSAQKKDGSHFDVQLSASMIYDINSNPISMLASFIDVTDRKKAEMEMNNALEEIKRSNAELEQFAYVASHDLQEPLRMVSGFANLLEKRLKENLDKDTQDFIAFIIDGVTRMHDLINDLLTFSRIGTQSRNFKPTDMNVVLEATLNNIRISAIETNAVITYDPLPVIIADESQMVQLLQNLISNAIKFHGSVTPKIHVSGEVKKDKWIFSVRDGGIGIDSKNFERIFLIFQRVHKKGDYPGTGIGLAVCKKIIQRHGGRIWVESELKKGSTFYFTISRKQNGASASKK